MYKKVTTVTEEYSDMPISGNGMKPAAINGNVDPCRLYAPCIRVDIPLMIRLLEYAREDASSDIDLHNLTAKMLEESLEGRVLTMADYEELVGMKEAITPVTPQV